MNATCLTLAKWMHEHIVIYMCKLWVSFRKRATNYRALLRTMTYKDQATFECLTVAKWMHENIVIYMCMYVSVCVYMHYLLQGRDRDLL